MKKASMFLVVFLLALGCARVRVGGSKEPIKLDISMRLDIYQHVAKDIDSIENMVSGAKPKTAGSDKQSLLGYFVTEAYAEEGLGAEVEQAALRRRDRRESLLPLLTQAVIGENKSGLLEIKSPDALNPGAKQLIQAENSDRMIIYRAVASKNGISVEEVQKLYAKRLQEDAPAGSPIEVSNQSSGAYLWQTK
jgi:uncharacterized protein YdbL (DUF1318 family)